MTSSSFHHAPTRLSLPLPTRVSLHLLLLLSITSAASLATTTTPPPQRILLYVDPTEERQHVLPSLEARGVECVLLHSNAAAAKIIEQVPEDNQEIIERVKSNEAPIPGTEHEWVADELPDGVEIVGVLCGSDGGLADAERLQDTLVPKRSNGINVARRDKYLMLEAMRSAGLGAPKQATPASWEQTETFVGSSSLSYPIVLKPRRGQASVLVGLARDADEAKRMDTALRDPTCHASIDTSELPAGDNNVLVQEYLKGEEWVVDTVSRNGEHKVLAIWKYDKREANHAPFVYFGIDAKGGIGEAEESVIAYACGCLDALGWQWGPTHIEIMLVDRNNNGGNGNGAAAAPEPVLIEINAGRWNGEEFQYLAELCYGYDVLEATLDAYLDEEAWQQIPHAPGELRVHGTNCKLVAREGGPLKESPAIAHAEALACMESLMHFEPLYSEEGEEVTPTIDLNSCAGYAHLVHADPEVIKRDYEAMHGLDLFAVDSG